MNNIKIEWYLSNVQVIDFYNEILNNPEYMMVDKVHLTETGNQAFVNILDNDLKKQL